MSAPWSFTARWVLPVASPPRGGAVVVVEGGRIAAIEPSGSRRVDLDLGNVAVLPGLVNAHTHLDLSGMRGLAPPALPMPEWLGRVVGHRRQRSAEQVAADIRAGLAECLRFGTTLVGDISGDGASWGPLSSAPLRAVVFRELIGLPEERASAAWDAFVAWRHSLSPALRGECLSEPEARAGVTVSLARASGSEAARERPERPTCRPGVSPHAPFSVRSSLFARAAGCGLPLMTHLAETRDELELLAQHRGVFVEFLRRLGAYDPAGLALSPADVIRLCSPAPKLLLAHGNYLGDEALPAHATLVFCPRTHQAFGHEPHPLEAMLARGVRVALGTDSLASSPDLDVLAEARLVRRLYPDLPGEAILCMATLAGAEALGFDDETGSLEPGKSADLVAVEIGDGSGDPHDLLFRGEGRVSRILFKGYWIGG